MFHQDDTEDMPETIFADMIGLIAPRFCAGCGRAGEVLCPDCRSLFVGIVRRPAPTGLIACGTVYSCALYEDHARSAILQWKDHDDIEAGRLLARHLCQLALHVLPPLAGKAVAIVPVPSSRQSVRRRGRVHIRELACPLVRALRRHGVSAHCVWAISCRGRQKKSVVHSHVAERQIRSRSAFRLARAARKLSCCPLVLLVDDICTTGSTLLACARLLARSGHRPLGALTLASVISQQEKDREKINAFHRTVFF